MRTALLVSMLLFLSNLYFSQSEQDTVYSIKINKEKSTVFRGADIETQEWYLYIDAYGIAYLANLLISEDEIESWFVKRSDSDNLFKSNDIIENNKLIFMSKKNEPETILPFQVVINQTCIELKNVENKLNFKFIPIDVQ